MFVDSGFCRPREQLMAMLIRGWFIPDELFTAGVIVPNRLCSSTVVENIFVNRDGDKDILCQQRRETGMVVTRRGMAIGECTTGARYLSDER